MNDSSKTSKKDKMMKVIIIIVGILCIIILVLLYNKMKLKEFLNNNIMRINEKVDDYFSFISNTMGYDIYGEYNVTEYKFVKKGEFIVKLEITYKSSDFNKYAKVKKDDKLAQDLYWSMNAIYFYQGDYDMSFDAGDGTVIKLEMVSSGDDDFTIYDDKNTKYSFSRTGIAEKNDDIVYVTWGHTTKNHSNDSINNTEDLGEKSYDAILKYGSGDVLICVSEDAMSRYMTALNKGDEGTIEEMQSNGEIGFTAEGTKCNIVERKATKYKVNLLDGAYAGNTVWVIIESVNEK